MIRPVSLLCFLVAVVAGAWLYQVKHEARLMDREILQMQRQADLARDRIAILRGEWALLNLPDRLRDVAGRHLSLGRVEPTQYASLADFSRRVGGEPAFVPTRAVASVRERDGDARDPAIRPASVTVNVAPAARAERAERAERENIVRDRDGSGARDGVVRPVMPAVLTAPAVRVAPQAAQTAAPVRRPAAVAPASPVARATATPDARPAHAVQTASTAVRTEARPAVQARAEPAVVAVSASVLGGMRTALAPPVPVGSR